ncbi:MAG: helix-turn-helix transcriptional regulator [Desulfobacteraceae bacterium]|nr:MAG: helix-turn-helix transcriptional regulator [Desulfobacteraceae bacterium]
MEKIIGSFEKTILDSLSAHVAILDKNGVIIETNKAWRNFGASNPFRSGSDWIGINYLKVCDTAQGEDAEYARQSAAGIREVMNGGLDEFLMEYPCHTPEKKMWFYLRVTRVEDAGPCRVVVSHENITPIKQAEEMIRKREEELAQKTRHLEDANTALKVLLQQHEMDKRDMEDRFVSNVRSFVMSYLEKLKDANPTPRQQQYIEIIEGHIRDILSPFLKRMSVLHQHLTPQEIKVASFVKEGRPTKEIADILRISSNAVDYHRKNIRKKLGLRHKSTNLQSFLMNVAEN